MVTWIDPEDANPVGAAIDAVSSVVDVMSGMIDDMSQRTEAISQRVIAWLELSQDEALPDSTRATYFTCAEEITTIMTRPKQ